MSAQPLSDPPPQEQPSEQEAQLRRITPIVLRGGLIAAMTFIGLGLLRYALDAHTYSANFHDLVTGARKPPPFSWRAEVLAALHLQPRGLVVVGLGFLTATPLARVLLSAIEFARAKNRLFVLLTSIVILLLVVAVFLGRIG